MIQYYHDRDYLDWYEGHDKEQLNPCSGRTVAIEVPEAWFFDTVVVGDFFEKRVGIARCHSEENYNKAIGREVATSRMKLTRLTVVRNSKDILKKHWIVLEDTAGNFYTLQKNNKVFLLDFEAADG